MSKFQFSWRQPNRALPRLLGLAALEYDDTQRPVALHFLLPRVLMLGLAVLLYLYLAVCGVIYWRISGEKYDQITFSELTWAFWPGQMEKLSVKRGQSAIRDGFHELREDRFWSAYRFLRYGLMRDPANMPGRQTLANLQLILGRPEEALITLGEGVNYAAPDERYLKLILDVSTLCEAYSEFIEMLEKTLERTDLSPPMRFKIQIEYMRTLDFAGLYDKGLEKARQYSQATPHPLYVDAEIQFLIKLERPLDGLELIERSKKNPGNSGAAFHDLTALCHIRAGNHEAALKSIREHVRLNSTNPNAYRFAIVQCMTMGRADEAEKYLDRALLLFGSSSEIIGQIASALIDINLGDTAFLLRKCDDAMKSIGGSRTVTLSTLVQSQLRRGQWESAAKNFAEMGSLPEISDRRLAPMVDWLTLMVSAAIDDSPTSAARLAQHMTNFPYTLILYYEAATMLRKLNQLDAAHKVLAAAKKRFSRSLRLNDQFQEVTQLIFERRTVTNTETDVDGTVAADRLGLNGSDPATFEKLKRAVLLQEWSHARDIIDVIRRANPEWLKDRSYEWEILRVRACLAVDDMVGTMLSVQVLLLDHREPAARDLAHIASTRWNLGKQDQASAIANAILQRFTPEVIDDRWLSDYAIRRELERSLREATPAPAPSEKPASLDAP